MLFFSPSSLQKIYLERIVAPLLEIQHGDTTVDFNYCVSEILRRSQVEILNIFKSVLNSLLLEL